MRAPLPHDNLDLWRRWRAPRVLRLIRIERGGIRLRRALRAAAALSGRTYSPDDIALAREDLKRLAGVR
jgi:hypothetical protein